MSCFSLTHPSKRYGFTVVLNCILLPLNLYRLQEMRNLIRKVDRARGSEIDMTWLRPFMSHRHINTGEVLFRKGDVAEAMYLVDSGHFVLSETGMEVPPGTVVGELGMLSPDGRRTQSLVCREAGEVQSLSYDRFEELYFQNPEFGLSFLEADQPSAVPKYRAARTGTGVAQQPEPSAADLKFLRHLQQARSGTSNR